MKIVRLFLLAVFTVVYSFAAQAQDKKVEFGIMAGYGHTMPKLKDSRALKTPAINEYNLNGYHVGPMLKFNASEQIGFQTGVLYNHFGGLYIDRSQLAMKKMDGTWRQTRTSLDAIDIPFRLVYNISLADELSAFIFAGPNLNYALTKTTSEEQYVTNKLTTNVKGENIYSEPTNFSALDLQMGAGLGLKFYGLSLRASYDWGLLNRTTLDDAILRSNDIKVSLGYSF